MLIGKSRFDKYCKQIIDALSDKLPNFTISMQTNGVLIDEEWIKLFEKYDIKLGISLDGNKAAHDKYRVDHQGRGSYERLIKAIKLLQKKNYDFGILTVFDPTTDPEELLDHYINVLQIKDLDFLWPDYCYEKKPDYEVERYGQFMSKALDYWFKLGDSKLHIRFLNSYMQAALGFGPTIYGASKGSVDDLHIFVIRSDGQLTPSDEFMSSNPETVMNTNCSIYNTSLRKFYDQRIFSELTRAAENPPQSCLSCCWYNICGGGSLVNRFSNQNRFDNPSIYCAGLKIFFSNLLQHLLKSGMNSNEIKKMLKI